MTEELLKSDIFFIVTTTAVVGVSLLLIIVLIYIVRIVRDINYIAKQAKKGVEEVVEDITVLHRIVKKKDRAIERMINSFINKYKKKK